MSNPFPLGKSKNQKADMLNSKKLENNIFKPVKKRRAFEEVSNEIKRLIFDGLLKRGDKLPSENELANHFNVGRQTIREALRYLELSGFITTVKGGAGGAVIVDTVLNTISNSIMDAIQMKKISLHDLVTARLGVEKMVLKQAIIHCDNDDIEALKKNVSEAKKKIASKKVAFSNNVQFHKILARASKNYLFVVMMEPIMAMTADLLSRRQSNLRLSSKVVNEHGELLDAIIQRDEAKALALLDKHLLAIEKRMAPLAKRDNM